MARSYNPNALLFDDQIVIRDTSASSKTGGALVIEGGLSTLDTTVTGHVAVNNVKITPNLNDIVYELQAVLSPATLEPADINDFRFVNAKTNTFKAIVNVTVSGAQPKYALWEINGVYKPSGWVLTTLFSGDITGVNFTIRNDTPGGFGQMQYTNSNGIGSTTTIRFRATTTAPAGSDPTNGESSIINNTSGSYIANKLIYSNAVDNVANISDLDYTSNVFTVAGGSRTVMQSTSAFTNMTNGGALTVMGDASVAQKMIVGTRVGIANTAPSFQLDVNGDINFTGSFYNNGNIYSGSSVWDTNGSNVFYTKGNLGIGTSAPGYKLEVVGNARISQGINSSTLTLSGEITSGSINVASTQDATSATGSAALLIQGGANIKKNLFVGGPAFKIPSGDTESRPANPVAGYIRYNSEFSQFEGFGAGNAWGSLGGVADIAQTTKILASSSPGATDGNLYFYNIGAETMRLNSAGNVGIGTSAPAYRLDVAGDARVTGLTAASAQITNVSGTAATMSSLLATNVSATNVTCSGAQLTNVSATAATVSNILATGLASTNMSATALTSGSALITNVQGTNASMSSVIATNVSASNVTSGNANITALTAGSGVVSHLTGTSATIGGIVATSMGTTVMSATDYTGGNLSLSGNLFIGGTLTTVNITSTNLVNTNVSAGIVFASTSLAAVGNSNTMGSIFTTGGNVGVATSAPGYTLDITGTFDVSNANGLLLFASSGNVGIGTTAPTSRLHVVGDIFATGNITGFSDMRLKSDIQTVDNALSKAKQLRGVYYTQNDNGRRGVGVIAQEIQEVVPEVVEPQGEYLSVAYGNISGVLIEAIKELSAKVESLEARLNQDQH